jgi:hypothetical protein
MCLIGGISMDRGNGGVQGKNLENKMSGKDGAEEEVVEKAWQQ